jgi:uncharacterized protein DUF4236
MSFRYRNVVSLGKYARVNLSKSGASLSVGPRGASINIGPRGVYQNTGIPGTGMSWRTKLAGGTSSQQQSQAKPGTVVANLAAQLEQMDAGLEHANAELKVLEAQIEAQELAVSEAREAVKTPADAAQVKIMEAKLAVSKLDLGKAYKERAEAEKSVEWAHRKYQAVLDDIKTKRILKWIAIAAVGIFVLAKCAGAQSSPAPTMAFTQNSSFGPSLRCSPASREQCERVCQNITSTGQCPAP